MSKNAFIQLQTIRLAESAPIQYGSWTSCRKSLSLTAERYWAELRGNVILLYPGSEILQQFEMHLRRKNGSISSALLQSLFEQKQESMKPQLYFSFIRNCTNRIPKEKIVPILFRICKRASNFSLRTITFTAYNSSTVFPQLSVNLSFDTYEAMRLWQEEVFKVPELYQETLSDFSLLRHIGHGATSDVFLVRDRFSRKKIALKAMEKEDAFPHRDSLRRFVDERIIYSRMRSHPYILEMGHAFETESMLYVTTEYCSRGDLFHYLRARGGKLSEEKARTVAAEVLLALETLHDQGIWYRDLKPENVMVADNGHVKLGDFGAAKIWHQNRSTSNRKQPIPRCTSAVGTVHYLAPEMARDKPHNWMVDLWAFGIFICELLNGETPFEGDTDSMTYCNINRSPLVLPITMSTEARDLVRRLLRRDASRRLGSGTNGWTDVKAHPWFDNVDWEMLSLLPGKRGPLGLNDEEEDKRPSAIEEDSFPLQLEKVSDLRAAHQTKQRALNKVAEEIVRDFKYTSSVRGTEVEDKSLNAPLSNKRNMKRTLGAYACGDRLAQASDPLPFASQEPLAQWQSSSQSSNVSRQRSRRGFFRKLCSSLKFWRRK